MEIGNKCIEIFRVYKALNFKAVRSFIITNQTCLRRLRFVNNQRLVYFLIPNSSKLLSLFELFTISYPVYVLSLDEYRF